MKTNRQNPIYSSTEDKLNRGHFVDYIINIIKNAPVKNKSFTIAINGKWGEGKTSVKNLVIEKLLYLKKTYSLALMDFNCKIFANQTDLNKAFLSKFIDTVKNKKRKRGFFNFIFNNKKIALYIILFLIILAGILYPNIFIRFSSIILTFLFIFKTQLRKVTISSIMDVMSKFYVKFDVIYKILYYDPITEHGVENSKLIKFIENKCLYDKVVIFIDIFDSLDENRLKMLMQLVNSKLDLPKVVFVLFYDKSIMESCLTTNIYSGYEFMEKFIDIQLDMPLITDDMLLNFLRNELLEKYNINIKYLNEFKYIKNYFMYLSKIYAFLDNFDLNFTLMVNNFKNNNFTFNKTDFFLLEILRFFENDVYRIIRKGKRILTRHNLKINTDKEAFWNKINENVKNNSKENIQKILLSLFPYLAVQLNLDNKGYNYNEDILILNKGVGYFDYFDYYFIYEMNEVVISEENFNILKKYLGNNMEFIIKFKQIFSIKDDNNIHIYTESVLRKIFKRVNEEELLNSIKEHRNKQKEFLKNIIWLYIYSNRNITSLEHLTSILLEYCKKFSFDNLLENLKLILNEFDYFNYFYVLEILNIIKFNLIEIICESDQLEREKYLLLINEILFKYVNFIFDNDNILEYLSKNSFNSRLQIHHIINFIKDKNLNNPNTDYILDNKIINYLNSDNFKKFKDSITINYFNLLYLFVEYSIKKKIINGDLYFVLDTESLFPFTIEELIEIFKKNNVSKKDKVFKLLLLSRVE